jgi:hypothetical protein
VIADFENIDAACDSWKILVITDFGNKNETPER